MKMFPPQRGLTNEELEKGHWLVYVDVKCADCGKEHALTNTVNGKCVRCGGKCS